jgi:hypothetical protein
MARSTQAEPIEIVVHDDTVIVTGLGGHNILLTPQAAERLASKLSAAAFAASCASRRSQNEKLDTAGWTTSAEMREPPQDQEDRSSSLHFVHRV